MDRHLAAWDAVGRTERPYLMNSLWFALGDGAREALGAATARYFGLPPGSASPLGELPVHHADGVKMAVENCRRAGFDELVFIPISDDLGQLDLLEATLAGL